MSDVIKVCFLGKFLMECSSGRIDEESIHSKKILKLLAYLLMNSDRMVSAEELGEFIWGNGGSANPLGALKNLIYRLRKTLKDLGPEEYILSRAGAYGWNHRVRIQVDIKELDRLAKKARTEPVALEQKIRNYEKALFCYRKPQTSVLTSDSWFAVRFTYYNSLYIKLVREICELYDQNQDYNKIQILCSYALTCDELDEDIHYWLILSWVRQEDMDNALKQYETAEKILYEKLGIHRSEKMQELYEAIISMTGNSGQATMDDIYDDIQEENPCGVFFCKYTVFREIYRLEARRILRAGIAEHTILLTLVPEDPVQTIDNVRLQYYKKRAMDKLQVTLGKSLRMGDVAARYSEEQYVIMLPSCSYEGAEKVVTRITANFNREMGNKKIGIKADIREVSIDFDLPSGEKGGAFRQ